MASLKSINHLCFLAKNPKLDCAGLLYDITEGKPCYPFSRQLCEEGGGHRELCYVLPNSSLSYQCLWYDNIAFELTLIISCSCPALIFSFIIMKIVFPDIDAGTGIALAGVFLYSRVKRIKPKAKTA